MNQKQFPSFWQSFSARFISYRLGCFALIVVSLFCLMAVYAPLLASSKPFFVEYQGDWYFPLFRYLFYPQFFTKKLDIFYNLMMFTLPLFLFVFYLRSKVGMIIVLILQISLFLFLVVKPLKNPAYNGTVKVEALNWKNELSKMNGYAKLNLLLQYRLMLEQQQALKPYQDAYTKIATKRGLSLQMPTLWNLYQSNLDQERDRLNDDSSQQQLDYLNDKEAWLKNESKQLHYRLMPLVRPFHWEDDAGGSQTLNQVVDWWNLSRINRKDMIAALIFGIRISLSVGLLSIALALLIGIPIGALSGYYGGKVDLISYRLIEVWESMPTFFILLFIVAFLQTKSIFVVMTVIGLFGWTSFSRFIRGEFFRQKQLSYVEASQAQGFQNSHIIFSHIMPNAIPPLLTLVPFAILGAITSEAALSFLGLGEEGSCSWGVLMDEGRSAFPAESYLLWPPAILLTILLVAIAIVGDTLRDCLDPKMLR